MGALVTYNELKKRSTPQGYWTQQGITGFNGEVVNPEQMITPQVDTSNAIQSLAQIMGPTPAEREAEQRRLAENKAKMNAWMGLFNGLGALGQLYGATKGASYAPMTVNPHQQIEQNYQQELGRLNDIYSKRQAYAQQLYNWQRMGEQDQMRREAHEAQMKYSKTREEALREDSRRKDEYNLARTKYYEAVASKNDEQAEYWRLRAQGVPQESAAKIAKDNALAAKANRTGGGSSRSDNQGYETIVTEGYDENGNKVKKTVRQPRQSPKVTKQPTKTTSNATRSGNSTGKGSNRSGFFNK